MDEARREVPAELMKQVTECAAFEAVVACLDFGEREDEHGNNI